MERSQRHVVHRGTSNVLHVIQGISVSPLDQDKADVIQTFAHALVGRRRLEHPVQLQILQSVLRAIPDIP